MRHYNLFPEMEIIYYSSYYLEYILDISRKSQFYMVNRYCVTCLFLIVLIRFSCYFRGQFIIERRGLSGFDVA